MGGAKAADAARCRGNPPGAIWRRSPQVVGGAGPNSGGAPEATGGEPLPVTAGGRGQVPSTIGTHWHLRAHDQARRLLLPRGPNGPELVLATGADPAPVGGEVSSSSDCTRTRTIEASARCRGQPGRIRYRNFVIACQINRRIHLAGRKSLVPDAREPQADEPGGVPELDVLARKAGTGLQTGVRGLHRGCGPKTHDSAHAGGVTGDRCWLI